MLGWPLCCGSAEMEEHLGVGPDDGHITRNGKGTNVASQSRFL